jgi:hypothetical protein
MSLVIHLEMKLIKFNLVNRMFLSNVKSVLKYHRVIELTPIK